MDFETALKYETLTPEQKLIYDRFTKALHEVCKLIRETVFQIWEQLKHFLLKLHKYPGYKRMAKAHMLERYEAMSAGKSNNWRKMHGLRLIRITADKGE